MQVGTGMAVDLEGGIQGPKRSASGRGAELVAATGHHTSSPWNTAASSRRRPVDVTPSATNTANAYAEWRSLLHLRARRAMPGARAPIPVRTAQPDNGWLVGDTVGIRIHVGPSPVSALWNPGA